MKAKKARKTVLIVGLVLTFIFSFLMLNFTASATLAAEPIILSMAPTTSGPPPALGLTTVFIDWANLLEVRSNGRLKIEIYWGESLAKGRDLVAAVSTGIADIGILCPHLEPGKIPLAGVCHLPGIGTHMWPRAQAYWELLHEGPLKSEMDRFNLHPIALHLLTDIGMVTNIPIKTVDDMKGQKIAAGGPVAETLQILGAVPINMSPGEQYDLLKKGTIKGITAPISAINDFKFYEPGKYFTRWQFGQRQGAAVINKDAYNKLPVDIQKIITDSSLLMVRLAYEDFVFSDNIAIEAMKKNGVEFFEPSPADQAKVKEVQAVLADKWAEALEKDGLPARKVLARFKELVQKYEEVGCNPYK